jgi:hypothetical protein
MKRIIIVYALLFFTAFIFAQAPDKLSYQAVVRNANGELIKNGEVGIRIQILQASEFGAALYAETHSITTNENGLATLEIGGGTVVTGIFATIDWANGPYFIKTEIDLTGGTNYSITGTNQLLSVPYALYAKKAETVTGTVYNIGDFANGGIIFWVDETGQHGLVCAKNDQDIIGIKDFRWYAGTYGNTQAKGGGPYAGKTNTVIIIAAQVAIGDDGETYAARSCHELQLTDEAFKTYGDWYLPSREELELMFENKTTIDSTATAHDGKGFDPTNYWSSTEENNDEAWMESLVDGTQVVHNKFLNCHVRAIRAF